VILDIGDKGIDAPPVYELVIGDFGRVASSEYVMLLTRIEQSLVHRYLSAGDDGDFYDEHRRIMFSLVSHVRYWKEPIIRDVLRRNGKLTDEVLISVGEHPVPRALIVRLALTVLLEASSAAARGCDEVRVVIPCNALTNVTSRIVDELNEPAARDQYWTLVEPARATLGNCNFPMLTAGSIPESVMWELDARPGAVRMGHVLLLGTRDTQQAYADPVERSGRKLVHLSSADYELIDRAVLDAIRWQDSRARALRDELFGQIVEPAMQAFETLQVVEACTDFRLGLGIRSLESLAKHRVWTTYRDLIEQRSEIETSLWT
jgi:hypothetical protein